MPKSRPANGERGTATRHNSLTTVENSRTVQPQHPDSLLAWITLYGQLEAGANAVGTVQHKARDLKLFYGFFVEQIGSDHPDQWTKPITAGFVRHLETVKQEKPTTINRRLATIKHCASWIDRHRPFLAGHPCEGIKDLDTDEPAWRGLTDLQVMRLKSAAVQLTKLKNREHQQPIRDYAVFLILLHTGLRVSELLALNRSSYVAKYLENITRKGNKRTAKIFLPQESRTALDAYVKTRTDKHPALFATNTGKHLSRQQFDRYLDQLCKQANAHLPEEQHIHASAHDLRHTHLRGLAREHGVEFAWQQSGHASARYIFRYVKPSQEEMEEALERGAK